MVRKFLTSTILVIALSLFSLPVRAEDEDINDPFETVNRGVFWFNTKLDDYLIGPITQGYRAVVPSRGRIAIKSFFDNLRYPMYLVSDLAQLEFSHAGTHTERFILNSTFGLLGLVDVAKDMGIEEHYTDIGVALGSNGVPTGPYLVIPILGPSNARDFVGRICDIALYPTSYTNYISNTPQDVENAISVGGNSFAYIQYRAAVDQAVRAAKESSLDYYLFVRAAYAQLRQGYIYDGNPPGDEDDSFDDQDEFK